MASFLIRATFAPLALSLSLLSACGIVDSDGPTKKGPTPQAAGSTKPIAWKPLTLAGSTGRYSLANFDCGAQSTALADTSGKFLQRDATKSYGSAAINKAFVLITAQITDGNTSCDYRVLFTRDRAKAAQTPASGSTSASPAPATITFRQSEALVLNGTAITGTQGCADTKATLDKAYSQASLALENDLTTATDTNIPSHWVALHLPAQLQAASACSAPSSSLRAYYTRMP